MPRHRAWYSSGDKHVHWEAPVWDPNGDYYDGPPAFSELSQVTQVDMASGVIQRSPKISTPHKLLDAVGSTTATPSGDTDGADITRWPEVNLYYDHSSGSFGESQIGIWLFDSSDWYPDDTLTLNKGKAVIPPYGTHGWERIYAQIKDAPDNGDLTVKIFPHNE